MIENFSKLYSYDTVFRIKKNNKICFPNKAMVMRVGAVCKK